MPRQPRDALDARIVELWRTGVQSARDVGLRIGLTPMHVGSRIARMVRSRTWPLDLPAKALRDDGMARQGARSRPPFRLEPTRRVAFAPLSLRIATDLHARLRTHCRETGATVSETLTEALEAFLRTKQGRR